MNEFFLQFMTSEVTIASAIFKLLLSLLLGAVIGIERRQKGQVAGMRTFSLIAMGATLAMLISIYIPQEYMGLKNGDPGRIAAQVISGIGFLGAGAIIQMKGSVRGLTTAAGIWMTACLGLAVGAGMYVIACSACVCVIVALRLFQLFEKYCLKDTEQKIVRVKVDEIITDTSVFRQCFQKYQVHVSDEFLRYDYNHSLTTINYMVRCSGEMQFTALFEELRHKAKVASLTLTNEVNN